MADQPGRRTQTGQQPTTQAGQQAVQQQDAAGALRDFKTQSRGLPEQQRREAFQSDEFRRLVAMLPLPLLLWPRCAPATAYLTAVLTATRTYDCALATTRKRYAHKVAILGDLCPLGE
jgi:hypothetical protein